MFIKLQSTQYTVISTDKRRNGEPIGVVYFDSGKYHLSSETDELLSTELRSIADTLDELNLEGEKKDA